MSTLTHVIVTLSPESIEAIGAFFLSVMTRKVRREPVLLLRPEQRVPGFEEQGSGQTAAIQAALEHRAEVTIRELAGVLGVPPEKQNRAMATGLGIELRELGWRPSQRGSGPLRERVYRPTAARRLDKDSLPL